MTFFAEKKRKPINNFRFILLFDIVVVKTIALKDRLHEYVLSGGHIEDRSVCVVV